MDSINGNTKHYAMRLVLPALDAHWTSTHMPTNDGDGLLFSDSVSVVCFPTLNNFERYSPYSTEWIYNVFNCACIESVK